MTNEARYEATKVKGLDNNLSEDIVKIKKKIDKLEKLKLTSNSEKVLEAQLSN